MLEQLHLLAVRHLAEVLDLRREVRPHVLLEVRDLRRLAPLAGDLQRQPRPDGDVDRPVQPLSGLMRPTKRR